MEHFFLLPKSAGKIKKNLVKLEKVLDIKLRLEGNNLIIEGEALAEYNALNVIKAFSNGFEMKTAILLRNEDFMMEEVKIKDYTRHNRLQQVKSRVIGSEGRALKTLSSLSECFLKLSDNSVFIIGHTDDVKITRNAVISLIKGSKHSNVYASLEHKPNFDEDEELIEQELQKYKKSHFSHQKAL